MSLSTAKFVTVFSLSMRQSVEREKGGCKGKEGRLVQVGEGNRHGEGGEQMERVGTEVTESTAKLTQRKAANGTRRVWGTMKTASHSKCESHNCEAAKG